MRACPTCKKTFDDDLDLCPDDGEELVEANELSRNPALKDVVAASPTERTSMIDLEAIEAKRKPKARSRARDDAGENTPLPEHTTEADPDATGTIGSRQGRQRSAMATQEGSRLSRVGGSAARSRTARSLGPDGVPTATAQPDDTRRSMLDAIPAPTGSPARAAALAGGGVLALLALVAWIAMGHAVLTVTTVPPGATVRIDGEVIGKSQVQKRVPVGTHTVELELEGYEPFKEVIEVKSGGLPFMQPLRQKPPPPPPPPTPEQIAVERSKEAERLLELGDVDTAAAKSKEAVELAPTIVEIQRVARLVDEALAARAAAAARAEAKDAREARLKASRVAFAEGEALYKADNLGPAKKKLYESLRLDAGYPEPHRLLGRIYNREDDIEKVRYHLERFLALGGADGDFKIRDWLKAHPKSP